MYDDLTSYKYCKWAMREDNQKVGVYVKKQCKIFVDIVEDDRVLLTPLATVKQYLKNDSKNK